MKFNYSNNIEFLNSKEFYLFKINNFLDLETYEKIFKSLQNININESENNELIVNKKIGIRPEHDLYKSQILSDKILKEFHDKVFSHSFVSWCFKSFYNKILFSKITDFHYLSKLLLRKNKFFYYTNSFNSKKIYEKFIYNHIWPNIEFSLMLNGAKIVPHTDTRSKLISLMLYFPDKFLTEEQKLNLGTCFFETNLKNLDNNHLRNEIDEKKFRLNSKKKIILPFEPFHLYGFVRTDKSWHTVETFNIDPLFIRKSININLLMN